MRTGRYCMAELFCNRYIDQLVIPEIQRDYVWGPDQTKRLMGAILENFANWKNANENSPFTIISGEDSSSSQIEHEDVKSLTAEFTSLYARRRYGTNIGFVYAYNDGDLPGQYYLIDGQQRLTTIFLALLAVASRCNDLKERFRARYCLQSSMSELDTRSITTKLDYRLREHTSEFLHHFVPYLLERPSAADQLRQQSWYRLKLNGDKTVNNLIANFQVIYDSLDATMSPATISSFFEYLENLVEFWYFDTNESAQGEELYIYLNARGENIAMNENLKALLLAQVKVSTEKDSWGKIWEQWQDFFWQRRGYGLATGGDNPNADRGFNSFLNCIKYLEILRSKKGNISPEVIKKYWCSLGWLEEKRIEFQREYTYSGWVDSWFNEIWIILNDTKMTNWDVDLNDKNKSTEHNRMVLLWGSFLSVVCSLENVGDKWEGVDHIKVFRTIRVFWLRYNNFNRAVGSLPESVNSMLLDSQKMFASSELNEEFAKWKLLRNRPEEERREFESTIWKIEDHPLNLKGRDLQGINISHVIDLDSSLTLETLKKVEEKFYKLFPIISQDADNVLRMTQELLYVRVVQALLYYGEFWSRDTPWYYENYNLGDWRRTIRGKGSLEVNQVTSTSTVFRSFFNDFIQTQQTIDEFLTCKQGSEEVNPSSETNLRKALIWYSEKAGKEFLKKGWYVAVNGPERDSHFKSLYAIWNTKGDFKGYQGNQKMADQIS